MSSVWLANVKPDYHSWNCSTTVQVASNSVTMRGDIVPFFGSGLSLSRISHTQEKKVAGSSRVCMTHSEEPRAAESGLRLPNETEYSFGDFMA